MTAIDAAPAPAPDATPRRRRRDRAELRPVVDHRRFPARVPALVAMGIVMTALLALAMVHALLITGQRNLDGVRRDVAAETEAIRVLRLEVAELEAPDRILNEARDRLGMVNPNEIGYLLPSGVDGGTTEPVRVEAAEPPPPPPAPAQVGPTASPEQVAVDTPEEPSSEAGDSTTPAVPPAADETSTDTERSDAPGDGEPADDDSPTETSTPTGDFDVGDGPVGDSE